MEVQERGGKEGSLNLFENQPVLYGEINRRDFGIFFTAIVLKTRKKKMIIRFT
jgi:hypothetical protein